VVAHDPDFMRLLRDCHRALKPGGLILIETPNMTLWRRLRTLRAALERVHFRSLSPDAVGAYGHINHFTARSLSDALVHVGFGETTSHWIRNHKGARGRLDDMKRFVFDVTGSRINVSFPLVMSARKSR
jgi:SAM-dependent methyltransferase